MQFYAEAVSIPHDDMVVFEQVRTILYVLPDIIFDADDKSFAGCKSQYSCHLICHALAQHFDVAAHDGYFTVGCKHSWLVPKSGASIIDVYPNRGAAPFIVAVNDDMSPWSRLYNDSDRFKHELTTDVFFDRLETTSRAVRVVKGQLGYR